MKNLFLILLIGALHYLNANIKAIDSNELDSLLKKGIKVIDIRHPIEIDKTGIIPNSYRLNYYEKDGKINKQKWLNAFVRIVQDKELKFVLVSKNGEKAKEGAELLFKKKKYLNPHYLEGGIASWIKDEKKIVKLNK